MGHACQYGETFRAVVLLRWRPYPWVTMTSTEIVSKLPRWGSVSFSQSLTCYYYEIAQFACWQRSTEEHMLMMGMRGSSLRRQDCPCQWTVFRQIINTSSGTKLKIKVTGKTKTKTKKYCKTKTKLKIIGKTKTKTKKWWKLKRN